MSGVVHSLSASITSALAVKPSTVYVLRVENTQTRDVWHLRRCFSDFCDLRERMLVLLDGGSSTPSSSSGAMGSAQNSPTTATATLTPMLTARRLLALNPSLRGGSAPGSNANSPRSTGSAGSGPVQERFPYLYTKFPRRQFFGSRSKKVIEQRTLALNQFLQEALWFLREVKTQHNIAMYFSLMTQLEVFLDCAKHSARAAAAPATSASSTGVATPPAGVCPPFYAAAHTTASPPTTKAPPAPVVPFQSIAPFASPETDGDAKDAADRARAVAARGFFWQPPPSHNGYHDHDDDESDEEADDYEERKVLKKSFSCFMSHEVRERRVSNPASQFVAALQSRASERDAVVSAADAWAARIEIAGIPQAEALRRRNSKNQAMLVKQYSSPVLSTKNGGTSGSGDPRSTVAFYSMKDQSPHVRRGYRA